MTRITAEEHSMGIRSDIPIPSRTGFPRSELGKFLSKIGIGQCFTVQKANRQTVYSLARYYGIQVSLRTTEEGVTVWRIA